MLKHSLTHNRFVALLLAFVTAACSSTANTPPPSPSPIVLATLPANLSTPSAAPTAVIESSTPAIEPFRLAGFQNVVLLPDDIMLPAKPGAANVIQSLGITGGAGGCWGPCCDETMPPTTFIDVGSVDLCNYPLDEQVTIELLGPDGSTSSQTIQAKGGRWPLYCFDRMHYLVPGIYHVTVNSASGTQGGNFEVKAQPAVFLYQQASGIEEQCGGHLKEAEPALIFYSGFQPNETIQVILYQSDPYQNEYRGYEYVTAWGATMDEQGRLVQSIQSPKVPLSWGSYVIVALGQQRTRLSYSYTLDEIIASALFNFYVEIARVPTNNQATPTPAALTTSRLPRLSYVQGGEFAMGSTTSDPFSEAIERPQHIVYVSDFWIEQTEVSNASYAECVAAGGCTLPLGTEVETLTDYYFSQFPVVNVTYTQAQAYCAWAGGRLPTEAEWEKAARGPEGRLYPWGNTPPDPSLANYGAKLGLTYDVGQVNAYALGATPLGVMNMAGNVWEWVADWFSPNYYASSPPKDPPGPETGTKRAVRGGAWTSAPQFLRTTNRWFHDPAKGDDNIGFRCVTTTAP